VYKGVTFAPATTKVLNILASKRKKRKIFKNFQKTLARLKEVVLLHPLRET
jgi:hypothetical protein